MSARGAAEPPGRVKKSASRGAVARVPPESSRYPREERGTTIPFPELCRGVPVRKGTRREARWGTRRVVTRQEDNSGRIVVPNEWWPPGRVYTGMYTPGDRAGRWYHLGDRDGSPRYTPPGMQLPHSGRGRPNPTIDKRGPQHPRSSDAPPQHQTAKASPHVQYTAEIDHLTKAASLFNSHVEPGGSRTT